MTTPEIEVVQAALAPLEPVLTRAFTNAWADWQSADLSHWRRRGRANYIWEQAAHYAATELDPMPSVSVLLKNESYHFLVDDQVSFRLKKSDSTGFTRNYPTQEALAFHDPQLPLTGIPAQHRVEVTYQLNEAETDLNDIVVVARDGEKILWTYSMLRDNSVTSLPTTQAAPQVEPDMARPTGLVRVKGAKTHNDDKAGDAGES
ncbi:hypothetical protein NTC87_01755 [Stenotrophomonas geniculata]|nr:hypothetical protein [Stenotrophomonas geniculata]